LGEVRVVVEARDLARADRDRLRLELSVRRLSVALEARRLHPAHARHGRDAGEQPAEVDRRAEREVVGVEEAEPPIRQRPGAAFVREGAVRGGREMTWRDADAERELEGYDRWLLHVEVVAGHAVAVEEGARGGDEGGILGQAPRAVGGDERRVPAARPAEACG